MINQFSVLLEISRSVIASAGAMKDSCQSQHPQSLIRCNEILDLSKS
jgi:hypothetical protein